MPLLLTYRRFVARFLLAAFGLMWVNMVAFRHAHKLPGGRVVVHSHPYQPVGNSPYQPNNHTAQELVWLDTFSQPVFEVPALAVVLPLLIFSLIVNLFRVKKNLFTPRVHRLCLLRGPPFR